MLETPPEIFLPFGRYKGSELRRLPPFYLNMLISMCSYREDAKLLLATFQAAKFGRCYPATEPFANSPFSRVLYTILEDLTMEKYHD